MSNHRYQPDIRIEKLDRYKKNAEYLAPLLKEITQMHIDEASLISDEQHMDFRKYVEYITAAKRIHSIKITAMLIEVIVMCLTFDLSIEGEVNKAIDIINDGYYHEDTET